MLPSGCSWTVCSPESIPCCTWCPQTPHKLREREKRPAIYTVINYSQVHIVRKKNKLLYKIRQRKSKPERIRRSSVQSAIECQCTGTVTLSLTVSVSCAVQFAPTRLLSCLLQASTNVNVWVMSAHRSTSHLRPLTWNPSSSLDRRRCCGGTNGTWCRNGTCWNRTCHSIRPAGYSTWSWLGCPCPTGVEHCVELVHAGIFKASIYFHEIDYML